MDKLFASLVYGPFILAKQQGGNVATLSEMKIKYAIDCLRRNDYDRNDTAKELGITYKTLSSYIKKYNSIDGNDVIDDDEYQFDDKAFYIFGTNEDRLEHMDWPNRYPSGRQGTRRKND